MSIWTREGVGEREFPVAESFKPRGLKERERVHSVERARRVDVYVGNDTHSVAKYTKSGLPYGYGGPLS